MNVAHSLSELESSDLVRRLIEQDPAYLIKHALVQDTAQGSLLKQERKRLNHLVAATMEELYAKRLDEYAARLAQHYDAAGEDAKTIEYAERAGDVAFRLSARTEAAAQYARALELAKRHVEMGAQMTRLYLQLGRTLELNMQHSGALELYAEMEELARTRGERAMQLAAMVQRASLYSVHTVHYQPEQAQALCDQAAELARELGDRRAEAKIEWCLMLLNVYGSGGARAGLPHGEKSLQLARELGWTEQLAYTLNDLTYIYLNLGDLTRMRAAQTEALALWRKLDDKPMLTDNLNVTAMQFTLQAEFTTALGRLDESGEISRAIGNVWGETTMAMVRAYTELVRGRLALAFQSFKRCLQLGEPLHMQGPVLLSYFHLAELYALFGDFETALQHANIGIERAGQFTPEWLSLGYTALANVEWARGNTALALEAIKGTGDAAPESYFERQLPGGAFHVVGTQARLSLVAGDTARAMSISEFMVNRATAGGMIIFVPSSLRMRAACHLVRAHFEEAAQDLDAALVVCAEHALHPDRWQLNATYARLEEARGDGIRADYYCAQARAELEALAQFVPLDYQASFLTTPFVLQELAEL